MTCFTDAELEALLKKEAEACAQVALSVGAEQAALSIREQRISNRKKETDDGYRHQETDQDQVATEDLLGEDDCPF